MAGSPTLFDRIAGGDGRERRRSAEALYQSLRGLVLEDIYRNPVFEEEFNLMTPSEQIAYVKRASEALANVEGYEPHSRNLAGLVDSMVEQNQVGIYLNEVLFVLKDMAVWYALTREKPHHLYVIPIEWRQNFHALAQLAIAKLNRAPQDGLLHKHLDSALVNKGYELVINGAITPVVKPLPNLN